MPFRVGVCALCFPVLGQQIVRPSRFEAVDDGDAYDGNGTAVMTPALLIHSYLGLCLCTVFAWVLSGSAPLQLLLMPVLCRRQWRKL